MTELDEFSEKAETSRANIHATYVWSLRQAADLRAKAELMERIDDDIEVYGTTDPSEIRAVANELEEISRMVTPNVRIQSNQI